MSKFNIKLLKPTAIVPKRGSANAAGYDLCACEDSLVYYSGLISTGIAIAIPHGYYARVASRSGLAVKGIEVGAGVIDSDYRGEVKVLLRYFNFTVEPFAIKAGDRIAQLIIEKIITPEPTVVDNLDDTVRNDGGFGSTGVNDAISYINNIDLDPVMHENKNYVYDNIKSPVDDMFKKVDKDLEFRCLGRDNCNGLLGPFPHDGKEHAVACQTCNKISFIFFKRSA